MQVPMLTAVRRERIRDRLGTVAPQNQLVQYGRTPLYHPDVPFVVLTSQKAGSTAVAKWFFLLTGLLEEAEAHSPWIHDFEQQVFIRRKGYLRTVRRAIGGGLPVVKVVRDPTARAFSGYLELNEHWAVLQRLDHWTVYWRRRVIRDLFGPDGDYAQPFSFVDYLGWLARQPTRRVNPHLAPQRTELEQRLLGRLHLRRLEDGIDVFLDLERDHGLPPSDPGELRSLVSSPHHNEKARLDGAGLSAALREGYRAFRPADAAFPELRTDALGHDPEVKALLRACFELDFEAYASLYPSP